MVQSKIRLARRPIRWYYLLRRRSILWTATIWNSGRFSKLQPLIGSKWSTLIGLKWSYLIGSKWGVILKTRKSILIEVTSGKICAGQKHKNHKTSQNILNEIVDSWWQNGDGIVALFNKSCDLEFVFFIKNPWTSDYLRALNPPIRSSDSNYPPIGFEDFISPRKQYSDDQKWPILPRLLP